MPILKLWYTLTLGRSCELCRSCNGTSRMPETLTIGTRDRPFRVFAYIRDWKFKNVLIEAGWNTRESKVYHILARLVETGGLLLSVQLLIAILATTHIHGDPTDPGYIVTIVLAESSLIVINAHPAAMSLVSISIASKGDRNSRDIASAGVSSNIVFRVPETRFSTENSRRSVPSIHLENTLLMRRLNMQFRTYLHLPRGSSRLFPLRFSTVVLEDSATIPAKSNSSLFSFHSHRRDLRPTLALHNFISSTLENCLIWNPSWRETKKKPTRRAFSSDAIGATLFPRRKTWSKWPISLVLVLQAPRSEENGNAGLWMEVATPSKRERAKGVGRLVLSDKGMRH
ncbi:hypothetical protein DL96DRAFT_1564388 [Flagelloscypha sp. PMI_526]|nr:hypothetical protein DL96DRAFT_1564388 [Flagelloscypha sp. PMI_526]